MTIGRLQMHHSQARPVRAISIRQPYAELILRGDKKKEFRSRPTNIRERLYVYGARKPAADTRSWRRANASPGELSTGPSSEPS